MMRPLQVAWEEFLYGGHLQCLGSIAILATVSDLFQARFSWGLAVSTYAVSYAVYVYNRVLEVAADEPTNPARSAYFARNRRAHWLAFFLSTVLGAVIVLATGSSAGAIFLGVVYVCGLLYTFPVKSLTRIIPGLKTVYVAAAFTALVFLPFVYSGAEIPVRALGPFTCWVFVNAIIMQILLDVKDLESDQRAGLRTIPLLAGRKATLGSLYALTIASAFPPVFWGTGALLAFAPLLSVVSIWFAQNGSYRGYLLESAKFMSWPALLALGRALQV